MSRFQEQNGRDRVLNNRGRNFMVVVLSHAKLIPIILWGRGRVARKIGITSGRIAGKLRNMTDGTREPEFCGIDCALSVRSRDRKYPGRVTRRILSVLISPSERAAYPCVSLVKRISRIDHGHLIR